MFVIKERKYYLSPSRWHLQSWGTGYPYHSVSAIYLSCLQDCKGLSLPCQVCRWCSEALPPGRWVRDRSWQPCPLPCNPRNGKHLNLWLKCLNKYEFTEHKNLYKKKICNFLRWLQRACSILRCVPFHLFPWCECNIYIPLCVCTGERASKQERVG